MQSNVKIGKLVICSVIVTIISEAIYRLGTIANMRYYTNPAYADVWSKVVMPTAGPPPQSFYLYSLLFTFITAVLFVLVFQIVLRGVPGSGPAMRGLMYGFLVFLVAGIPGMLSMYLLIHLPTGLIWSWTIQGFIVYLVTGLVVGAINRG
jgi:hypothetical protein